MKWVYGRVGLDRSAIGYPSKFMELEAAGLPGMDQDDQKWVRLGIPTRDGVFAHSPGLHVVEV